MAKKDDIIKNFESILKHQSRQKPLPLYRKNENVFPTETCEKNTCNAKDILTQVTDQIKAIQKADCAKYVKPDVKKLNMYKKKQLLSLNMLIGADEVKPQKQLNTNKFETQCVTDTQLINIIENAEALAETDKGITQEFDLTFVNTDISEGDIINKMADKADRAENKSNNTNKTNNNTESQEINEKINEVVEYKLNLEEDNIIFKSQNLFETQALIDDIDKEVVEEIKITDVEVKDRSEVRFTEKKNFDITENIITLDVLDYNIRESNISEKVPPDINNMHIIEDSDMVISPILNIKPIHSKVMTSSPFIVDLEKFELFEKLAAPLVEGNIDLKLVKQVINSQIINNDLFLKTNIETGDDINDSNKQLSQIHGPNRNIRNAVLHDSNPKPENTLIKSNEYLNKKDVIFKSEKDTFDKNSTELKDEILFSSDEENPYDQHKPVEYFPYTCVLEPFFDNKSEIFDKTMYVGFQTASNKSIQVCKDSFYKAKSLLNTDTCRKEPTLTELVELYNVTRSKTNSSNFLKNNGNKATSNSVDTINERGSFSTVNNETSVKSLCKETINHEGFKTASNKCIKLSEQALTVCKRVFQDIDISETYNEKNPTNTKPKNEEINANINWIDNGNVLTENQVNTMLPDIGDNSIIQEFENCDMVHEDIEDNIKNKPQKDSMYFSGFKTASNKDIVVSDAALAKIKDLFVDIDDVSEKKNENIEVFDSNTTPNGVKINEICEHEHIEIEFAGFKTASDKNITISANAFAKSRTIFQDIEFDDLKVNDIQKKEQNNNDPTDNEVSVFENNFAGFKTASNKKIKISEKALVKTKDIFKDIEYNTINNTKDSSNKENISFKTACDQNVEVSEEALVRTSQIFNDINDLKTQVITFKTASNKEIIISEEAKAKTKRIFDDIDTQTIKNNHSEKIPSYVGFKTANQRNIQISEEAIAKTRTIFQDIDITDFTKPTTSSSNNSISSNLCNRRNNMVDKIPKHTENGVGFKTANNKDVIISEKALTESKKLFENIVPEKYQKSSEINQKDNSEIPRCHGFQTANNEPVIISVKALENTKKIFQDIQDLPNHIVPDELKTDRIETNEKNYENILQETSKSNFKGFQTASKKKVTISEEALAKSKSVFQDIDKNIIEGFKTASNNKINVNQDKLDEAKNIFMDIDNDLGTNIKCKELKLITAKNNIGQVNKEEDMNIVGIIDTQVINNFEMELNTEDFCKDKLERSIKRPGSPILSCPKAKKRKKFETPFNSDAKKIGGTIVSPVVAESNQMSLFAENYKRNKKIRLKDLENIEKCHKNNRKGVDPYILQHNFDQLLRFEFFENRNDLTFENITTDKLKILFLKSVNAKIIPPGWLDNHLKLILWKLISYEINYPNAMGVVCTAKNVMDQLKYRYARELYNVVRPALRKIMERDDSAAKTIVLCVVDIFVNGEKVHSVANPTDNTELLLTDGWYCVKASLDRMLSKLVYDGKIVVGCKLVTHGAELMNCEQGISPWEDTSRVRLKLYGNSTRRARWDARLGYHGDGRHGNGVLTRLSAVRPEGGRVPGLRLHVARVYPALYVERFEDGSTVTRSERLENLYQMQYETERQLLVEKIYEDIEKEFSEEESQDSERSTGSGKRPRLDSGSQIARAMKGCKDPAEFKCHLTSSQSLLLEAHAAERRERALQGLQARVQEELARRGAAAGRNVVTLLKARVAAWDESGGRHRLTKGMLSIWKPNDAILDIVKEGTWIDVLNVVPTGIRYSEIQISAGRQSMFSRSKYTECDKLRPHTQSLRRSCYHIRDVVKNPAATTDYNEIDTVGMIFHIEPSNEEFDAIKNQTFQNVYFTDADKNLISVNFWGGIKKFGFENILDTGQIVTCVNLQRRIGNTRKSIQQYRCTEFTYFTKTPKSEKAREMAEELVRKFSGIDRRKFCEDCINLKANYSALNRQNNENVSPYRFNNSDCNLSRNKVFIETPLGQKNRIVEEDFNLAGLDFESTFKQTDTQSLSPKSMARKQRVNERISKLKLYGEPPPLSPIQIINKSKKASGSYKSPLISNGDSSNCVARAENKLPNDSLVSNKEDHLIQSSPVMQVNRKFVKRVYINPVKLDFSKTAMEANDSGGDQFVEEFEGSPPLSLDSVDCI